MKPSLCTLLFIFYSLIATNIFAEDFLVIYTFIDNDSTHIDELTVTPLIRNSWQQVNLPINSQQYVYGLQFRCTGQAMYLDSLIIRKTNYRPIVLDDFQDYPYETSDNFIKAAKDGVPYKMWRGEYVTDGNKRSISVDSNSITKRDRYMYVRFIKGTWGLDSYALWFTFFFGENFLQYPNMNMLDWNDVYEISFKYEFTGAPITAVSGRVSSSSNKVKMNIRNNNLRITVPFNYHSLGMTIFTISGKNLASYHITENRNTTDFDISYLPSGSYIATFIIDDFFKEKSIFVKQGF